MKPHNHYIWQPGCVPLPDTEADRNIETTSMRVAWDAECAKVQAPARITYADLAFLADHGQFVRLFEECLAFDDTGLTMQRRG